MGSLQQIVTKGSYTLPLTVFITLACWTLADVLTPEISVETTSPLWDYLDDALPEWGARGLSLLFTLLSGYFLIRFNNSYSLIRRRASMQTSLYLLFITACPVLHAFYPSSLIAIPVLYAIYNLFCCYQCKDPGKYILSTFVFLGLGTLLFPQLFLFVPVFLFGVSYINDLSFRNFLISIVGLSIPYWFLWSYAYYTDNIAIFYQPFITLIDFQPISMEGLCHEGWAIYIYFFLVFLISSVNYLINAHRDKISTRLYLRFLITLVFFLFLYIFLQPAYSLYLLSLTIAGLSILAAHFFVLSNSKASNLFFICTVLGLILLFGYNIWMLL